MGTSWLTSTESGVGGFDGGIFLEFKSKAEREQT